MLWNAAAYDFEPSKIAPLFAGEWLQLTNRAIDRVIHSNYGIFGNNYMTEADISQSDGKVDISELGIMMGGHESRMSFVASMGRVDEIALSGSQLQSQTAISLPIGTTAVAFNVPMNSDYIISAKVKNIAGDDIAWQISNRTLSGFSINVAEVGASLSWIAKRKGTFLSSVYATEGSKIVPVKQRKKVSLVAGSNTVTLDNRMVGDYEVRIEKGFCYNGGGEVAYGNITKNALNFVIADVGDTATLEYEIFGNALLAGTVLAQRYEINASQAISAGTTTITFASSALANDWIFAVFQCYDANGAAISFSISNRTSTSFDINVGSNATIEYSVAEVGITISDLVSTQEVWSKASDEASFYTFRPNAFQNKNKIVYCYQGNYLLVKKGCGLADWTGLLIRYPRTPIWVTAVASFVDAPDGNAIELIILALKKEISERCRIEYKPDENETMRTANAIYQSAGQSINSEQQKQKVKAIL